MSAKPAGFVPILARTTIWEWPLSSSQLPRQVRPRKTTRLCSFWIWLAKTTSSMLLLPSLSVSDLDAGKCPCADTLSVYSPGGTLANWYCPLPRSAFATGSIRRSCSSSLSNTTKARLGQSLNSRPSLDTNPVSCADGFCTNAKPLSPSSCAPARNVCCVSLHKMSCCCVWNPSNEIANWCPVAEVARENMP